MLETSKAFRDPEFRIECRTTDDSVDIWLHGIVGDSMSDSDSASIGKLLQSHRGKPVTLRVNSPGGLAYDGVAIYTALQEHDGPTKGIIEGEAGSAASLAIMACDTIVSHSTGVFHPHYSLCLVYGHRSEVLNTLKAMELLDSQLVEIYAARTGRTKEEIRQHLEGPHGDGTRFSAAEAQNAGYVHEIIPIKAKSAGKRAESQAVNSLRFLRQSLLTTARR